MQRLDLTATNLGNEKSELMKSVHHLKSLILSQTDINDAALSLIPTQVQDSNLIEINVSQTSISNLSVKVIYNIFNIIVITLIEILVFNVIS